MRAFSVFANSETDSVVLNFSEDFLDLNYEERLDILDDALTQFNFIHTRLTERNKRW